MILRLVVVIVGLFTLVLFGLLFGLIVYPVYDLAFESTAVQAMGYDDPLETALFLGGTLTLPLLAVALLLWAHTHSLRQDVGRRRL